MNKQPAQIRWRKLADRLARFAARNLYRRRVEALNDNALVSFTFDDIDATAASMGARILEGLGVRGTFYVAGRYCEESSEHGPYASLRACRELAERGHEIGCHTYAHEPVRRLSARALLADVEHNSRILIGEGSAAKLESFAFPYNAPTLTGKRVLQRRFSSCRGGVPGINSGHIDLAFLRAVELTDMGSAQALIDEAVARRGWLIFFTHDVRSAPSRYGCTPDLLSSAVAASIRSGATIATVRDAVRKVLGSAAPETRAVDKVEDEARAVLQR